MARMWVEFVSGSRPCSKDFLPVVLFSFLHKKLLISKFQFDPESEGHRFVNQLL